MKAKVIRQLAWLLLFFAVSAASTDCAFVTTIELGLYEGSTAGPMLMNATTTITPSSGGKPLLSMNGAWPHGTLALAPDVYTITVTVPASADSAGIDYSIKAPLATQIPLSTFTISNISGKIAFNSSGQHGQFDLRESGTF